MDRDGDGVTVADGDCNDTIATTLPGAPELRNSRDDDCNGQVDDPFVHHVLLNDGTGHLVRADDATSGVAIHAALAAGAVADYDADGHLDVFMGHWLHHYPDPAAQVSVLFRGRGDGTFEDVNVATGLDVSRPRPVYGVTFNNGAFACTGWNLNTRGVGTWVYSNANLDAWQISLWGAVFTFNERGEVFLSGRLAGHLQP